MNAPDRGEVCIAGASVMKGYVDGSTPAVLRDGWLRSGDLGRFDADGYLFITGRLKDVIVRGGENLSPRAIESTLERHPAPPRARALGRRDPRPSRRRPHPPGRCLRPLRAARGRRAS